MDQAESDAARQSAIEWWNGSMSTRLNDLAIGHKVVIQQRLHEADLSGDLLQRGGYELLCLPAEYEPERQCRTSIGWSDQRRELGQLPWPEKMTRESLEEQKVTLGSYRYAGQYQQRPSPARAVYSNGPGGATGVLRIASWRRCRFAWPTVNCAVWWPCPCRNGSSR